MNTANNYSEATVYLNNLCTLLNAHFFTEKALPSPTVVVLPNCLHPAFFVPRTDAWSTSSGTTAEINISAEFIGQPILEVLTALLHEMIHYANYLDGKKDCSRGGHYHNKVFQRTATKHGLVVEYDKMYGWSKIHPSQELLDIVQHYHLTDIRTYRNSHPLLNAGNSKTSNSTASTFTASRSPSKSATRIRKTQYVCPCCGKSIFAVQDINVLCLDCNEQFEKYTKGNK